MLSVSSLIAITSLAMVLVTTDRPKAEADLLSPFPRTSMIAAAPAVSSAKLKCETPPPAVRDIIVDSKFGEDRRSHNSTVVDPESAANYAESTKALTAYTRRVAGMADRFADPTSAGARDTRCALLWMNAWAEQDALLGEVNATGESVRKWELATLATAYLKIRDGSLDPERSARVRRWLKRLAEKVRADYSRNLEADSRSNNHLNWAAWAVMAAAIGADDRELFDWSVDRFHYALAQIADDGTLPLELKRRHLAAAYHNYALAPLILTREGAAANGIALSAGEAAHLQKLVDVVISSYTDPALLEARTGHRQDLSKVSATHLAWLEPYYARSHDPRVRDLIERNRPLSFSRLGGNLTALFGEGRGAPKPPTTAPDR